MFRLVASIVYLILDLMYFGLNSLLGSRSVYSTIRIIRVVPAIFVYLLYPIVVSFFTQGKEDSGVAAFLLGISTYGMYNLTNLATLQSWTPALALQDTLWGGIVSYLIS